MNSQSSVPGRNPESTISGTFGSSTSPPRMPEKWVAPAVIEVASRVSATSGVRVPAASSQ